MEEADFSGLGSLGGPTVTLANYQEIKTPHHQHHDFEMIEADLDGLSPLARLPRCPRPGREGGQEDGRELRRRPT